MKRWVLLAILVACASGGLRPFPRSGPMLRDGDLDSRSVPCRKGKENPVCRPDEHETSIVWDFADNALFRPVSRFLAADPAGESVNVNALDEVPDSSWFTNRMGARHLSIDELVHGPCGDKLIDADVPDGSILIDQGKDTGANPGFRVKMPDGTKYMFKADGKGDPERPTGATAIASRMYHAAGWWAACDTVVYVRPSQLKLKPGLTVTDNSGVTRPFDQKALEQVLATTTHRAGKARFAASRWLPGRTIGSWTYEGTKDDDPNDVVPHEDRRDLRGARLMAAWLNHYDSREANTMATWMSDDGKQPDSSPGHVVHYYIDLGDCFGGHWDPDELWRRMGQSYYFDLGYMIGDFFTLGLIPRRWDKVHKPPRTLFGYYGPEQFDPDAWRGFYSNPAFERMTERDGAWFARIAARFTDEDLAAIAGVGDFSDPAQTAYLAKAMAARRDIILRRYFGYVSPITDVTLDGDTLCAVDLARATGVFPKQTYRYEARAADQALQVDARDAGQICMRVPHNHGYLVVEIKNGQARGSLKAHLYDLGANGFQLAGLERNDPGP